MPNWSSVAVDIFGDERTISKIQQHLSGIETCEGKVQPNVFDLNKIIPVPQALLDTDSYDAGFNEVALNYYCMLECVPFPSSEFILFRSRGAETDRIKKFQDPKKECQKYHQNNPKEEHLLYRHGKKVYQNLKTYGYLDWYEWCLANWSTKWNTSEACLHPQGSSKRLSYTFLTPWTAPYKALKRLSREYPGVSIVMNEQREEGDRYQMLFENGQWYDVPAPEQG